MFRPTKLSLWLPIALLAAWLSSCSSNVDGYYLATTDAALSAAGTGNVPPASGGGSGTGGRVVSGSGGGDTGGGTGGVDLDPGHRSVGGGGGAPTGGAPTGGAPTGGAPTGGAPTGGVGGTGGYPGNPTSVSLSPSVTGITAAAWEPISKEFYLLKPSMRQYFSLSTTGIVSAAKPL